MHKPMVWLVLGLNQLAWTIAVLGGARQQWWPGLAAVAVVVTVHLLWVQRRDARLVLLSIPIGLTADSLLGLSGVCAWPEQRVPPLWLTALWPNFAVLLGGCLQWLVRKPLVWAVVLGAAGGPLAYAGGAQLGAVSFPLGVLPGCLAIALVWALACPALVHLARQPEPLHA